MTSDPHLERVTPYSPIGRRAAVAEVVAALAGFVAALVLMPGLARDDRALRRLLCRGRSLPVRLLAATAPPAAHGDATSAADVVEVRRSRRRSTMVRRMLLAPAVLLGAAWLTAAVEHTPFAWGLVAAATLVGTGFAADIVELAAIRRWERRNGRILTSLLLGEGEVFYVERGAHAA